MPLTWKDRVKQAVTTGGTGALVIGSAAAGYQALGAADDAKLFSYVIEDGPAWETGYGTYTHSGTSFARTTRTASSTGSALNVTTAANLFVDVVSNIVDNMNLAAQAIIPGGRLTLTSGTPVTTADVTAATSIYYTPYLHNIINLWDGNIWKCITFAEYTLALGTLTSGKPYDVFSYLSSGALALEVLVWTNGTTRATTVTLQDGRLCKNGDKTRLYLGTFYTTATTTTEDSVLKRFLWNMYNRNRRSLRAVDSADSWTYNSATIRQANANTANKVEVCVGQGDDLINLFVSEIATTPALASACQGIGVDSTTTFSANGLPAFVGATVGSAVNSMSDCGTLNDVVAVGYHYYSWNEKATTANSVTFYGDGGLSAATGLQCGLSGFMQA